MKVVVRYGLPLSVLVAGFIVLSLLGNTAALVGWAMIAAFVLKIVFLGEVLRIGFSGGNKSRVEEEEARQFLAVNGHWPDEAQEALPPRH